VQPLIRQSLLLYATWQLIGGFVRIALDKWLRKYYSGNDTGGIDITSNGTLGPESMTRHLKKASLKRLRLAETTSHANTNSANSQGAWNRIEPLAAVLSTWQSLRIAAKLLATIELGTKSPFVVRLVATGKFLDP
jgi:hypothetical protein